MITVVSHHQISMLLFQDKKRNFMTEVRTLECELDLFENHIPVWSNRK